MHSCPYCSYPIVRQISYGSIVWFCRHCWIYLPTECSNYSKTRYARQFLGNQNLPES